MSGIMDMITGRSAAQARREQEISRQRQEVAQNRQLSEMNRADSGMRRRSPRGRRLFADAGEQNLSSSLA